MKVFVDQQGQYYAAEEAKSENDSWIPNPSDSMLELLKDSDTKSSVQVEEGMQELNNKQVDTDEALPEDVQVETLQSSSEQSSSSSGSSAGSNKDELLEQLKQMKTTSVLPAVSQPVSEASEGKEGEGDKDRNTETTGASEKLFTNEGTTELGSKPGETEHDTEHPKTE